MVYKFPYLFSFISSELLMGCTRSPACKCIVDIASYFKAVVLLLFGDQSKLTRCEIRVLVLALEFLLYDIVHQTCAQSMG